MKRVVALIPVVSAVACQCDRYRCRKEDAEYVYALEEMPSQGMIECMQANRAYTPRGDCKYCSSCDGNVCECQGSMACDTLLPTAAAVVCIVLGLMLCLLGVRSTCSWYKRHYRVKPYDECEVRTWEKKASVAIGLPCCGAVLFIGVGILVWMSPSILDQAGGFALGG
mmetsp:Transcript_52343/g.109051  ORF Transcript_52343/g.109051 Transcript_52343/m.109051 type:complete len:168 (-) Transcript_52343:161-664(-)|eukprot:s2923_g6.t1